MNQQTRNLLFKFACIPMRILIIVSLVIFASNNIFRSVAAVLCFMVFATFSVKYFNNDKVGGFGGQVWWHANRPKHALLYLTTGILLILKFEWAGYILAADVFIGVYSYCTKETVKTIEELDIPVF